MFTARPRPAKGIAPLAGSIAALLFCGHALSASVEIPGNTWSTNPGSGDWNTASNWNPAGVPNSSTATANFFTSSITNVSTSSSVVIGQIIFQPGANSYTINVANSMTVEGTGIVNNSSNTQYFVINGTTGFIPGPADLPRNVVIHHDIFSGGDMSFYGTSTAGTNTVITVQGADGVEGSSGSLHFWETSTAGGATLIATGGILGSSGGKIYFEGNSSGGTAAVQVYGNGFLDISNHAAGSVTIGSLAGNGLVFLGSNNLTVGSNNATTVFSGIIQQDGGEGGGTNGSLTKIGTGTLYLDGKNTYTGPTIVLGGALIVNGSIASQSVFTTQGGTFGGTGVIAGNFYNLGNAEPGDAPGVLIVKGNYTQVHGSSLTIQIGGSAAGQFSALAVQGQANIDGGDLRLQQIGSTPKLKVGDQLALLSAGGGIIGKFDKIYNPIVTGTIVQDNVVSTYNTIYLKAEQGSFGKFARQAGLTPNQQAVAQGLDSAAGDPRAHSLYSYIDYRLLRDLPGDFDKIAPAELTSIFTVGTSIDKIQSLNLQRRTDDIRSGSSGFSAAGFAINGIQMGGGNFSLGPGSAGPSGDDGKESKEVKEVAPAESRWGAFISGTGDWVNVSGNENARGYDITNGGFTFGADYKLTPHFAVGIMAGYVGTSADLVDHDRVWVNGGKIGLYSTAFAGGWYADGAVTGGYSSYDTRRTGLQGEARGDTDGGDLNALFGTGYDLKKGNFTFGPTASFNYTYTGIGGFTEHGSLAPLDIRGEGESIRTAFGMKASYDWKTGGVVIKPELRLAWQHEYGDAAYSLDSSFANGAGSTFTTSGPKLGRDSLLVGAGFAIQLSDRCATFLYYDGELARTNYLSNAVSGGFRIAF
jgi:autotransporter-associated beta strand protein